MTTLDATSPRSESPRRFDTTVLLASAALLIINSHLEDFYPRRWMAADGLLGVSIFYMLSGFGVQSSLLVRSQSFLSYYARRLWRLYPAVLIVLIAVSLLRGPAIWDLSPKAILSTFIWPTQYTYVQWIVPFYAVLYFVGRDATPKRYAVLIPLLLAGYATSAARDVFVIGVAKPLQLGNLSLLNQTMHYALAFFVGGALATMQPTMSTRGMLAALMGTILSGCGYVGLKFLMVVKGVGDDFFWLLHLLVLGVCVLSFMVLTHERVLKPIRSVRVLWWGIAVLAAMTLETYIVHEPLAHWARLAGIVFPLNIVALVALTMVLSVPLHLLTTGKLPFPRKNG